MKSTILTLSLLLLVGSGCSHTTNPNSSNTSLSDNSLVAYLNFENGIVDASDHGDSVITVGNPSLSQGVIGNGLSCSGQNGLNVIISQLPTGDSGSITLTAWVNLAAGGQFKHNKYFLTYGGPSGYHFSLGYNSTIDQFGMDDGDWGDIRLVRGGPTGVRGSFHHIAVTYRPVKTTDDLSTLNLVFYVDGQSVAGGTHLHLLATPSPLLVSMPPNTDTSSGFVGIIDQVRLYNRALSASEIMTLYTNKE
jgi:hypothetical protein